MTQLTGRPLRPYREVSGAYALEVAASRPTYQWRMGNPQRKLLEADGGARFDGAVAFYLEGVSGRGFGRPYESRSAQLVGGYFVVPKLSSQNGYALEFWFSNFLSSDLRPVTGTLFSWGQDVLEISGTDSKQGGRLKWGDALGKTPLRRRHWNHVVVARRGDDVYVYLNGEGEPELSVRASWSQAGGAMHLGGEPDGSSNFEGRIDEVAFYAGGLSVERIRAHYQAAGR